MEMVMQHADRDRFKRTALLSQSIRSPQTFNLIHQQILLTVGKSDREKENAAFDLGAAILRHDKSILRVRWAPRKSVVARGRLMLLIP